MASFISNLLFKSSPPKQEQPPQGKKSNRDSTSSKHSQLSDGHFSDGGGSLEGQVVLKHESQKKDETKAVDYAQQTSLRKLEADVLALNNKLEEANQDREKRLSEVQEERQTNKKLQQAINALQASKESKEGALQKLNEAKEGALQKLNEANEVLLETIKERDNKIVEAEAMNSKLIKAADTMQSKVLSLTTDVSTLQSKCEALEKGIKEADKYKQKFSDLESEIKTLKEDIEDSNYRRATLQGKIQVAERLLKPATSRSTFAENVYSILNATTPTNDAYTTTDAYPTTTQSGPSEELATKPQFDSQTRQVAGGSPSVRSVRAEPVRVVDAASGLRKIPMFCAKNTSDLPSGISSGKTSLNYTAMTRLDIVDLLNEGGEECTPKLSFFIKSYPL